MKAQLSTHALKLPNNLLLSIVGYADDSPVLVSNDDGIRECFSIVKRYEKSTGGKLNMDKTSIFGMGEWKERDMWPVTGLKEIKGNCKILGVIHDNCYINSVIANWESMEMNIRKCVGMLLSRKLSLFQKAIVINCKILAKCWYLSHVYPLPKEVAKRIQKCLFKYLWSGNYEPINRETMYLPKYRGGCGLINLFCKSRALLFSTFLKIFTDEKQPGFKLRVFIVK